MGYIFHVFTSVVLLTVDGQRCIYAIDYYNASCLNHQQAWESKVPPPKATPPKK